MSVNQPPNPNLDTFNNTYWIPDPNDINLDGKYLRFPIAQGAETLQQTTINGDLTLNQSKIHLGTRSGFTQGTNSVSIGFQTANQSQGNNCVSLGHNAGQTNQGNNSICIGHNSGTTNQPLRSIQINSTGTNISQTLADTCVIAPIRNTGNTDYYNDAQLFYNISTSEVYRVNLIAFPQLFSGANTLPVAAGGFVANIRNIVDIPAGLWEFNWSVSSDTVGTSAYGIMVQFGTAPPTTLNVAAGSNYGAVCNRETFNANSSVPMSHYQSFLYESNGAAGLNAYLCGFFSALAVGSFVAADFTFGARKIR